MTDPARPSPERLARECRTLSWALAADAPTDSVIEAYTRAHARPPLDGAGAPIDRLLLAVGSVHPWFARLADAYSALFVRRGLFRTKLVVLLAMLESTAPHHVRFEVEETTPAAAWMRLTISGIAAVLSLLGGALVFLLPHVLSLPFGGSSEPGDAA